MAHEGAEAVLLGGLPAPAGGDPAGRPGLPQPGGPDPAPRLRRELLPLLRPAPSPELLRPPAGHGAVVVAGHSAGGLDRGPARAGAVELHPGLWAAGGGLPAAIRPAGGAAHGRDGQPLAAAAGVRRPAAAARCPPAAGGGAARLVAGPPSPQPPDGGGRGPGAGGDPRRPHPLQVPELSGAGVAAGDPAGPVAAQPALAAGRNPAGAAGLVGGVGAAVALECPPWLGVVRLPLRPHRP